MFLSRINLGLDLFLSCSLFSDIFLNSECRHWAPFYGPENIKGKKTHCLDLGRIKLCKHSHGPDCGPLPFKDSGEVSQGHVGAGLCLSLPVR